MSANELEPKEAAKPPQEQTTRARDRRAFRRRPLRAKIRYQADDMGLGSFIDCVPLDVSEGGISFTTSKPPAIRAVITVEISRPSISKGIRRPAEVLWVSMLEEGQYRVGCRWERRLSFSEMQQFQ